MKRKPVTDKVRFDGAEQSDYLYYAHMFTVFFLFKRNIISYMNNAMYHILDITSNLNI